MNPIVKILLFSVGGAIVLNIIELLFILDFPTWVYIVWGAGVGLCVPSIEAKKEEEGM